MEYVALLAARDGDNCRAYEIVRKYYTTWDRDTGEVYPPGAVRVGATDPYRLREDIIRLLLAK
jgi:hypothetical protein